MIADLTSMVLCDSPGIRHLLLADDKAATNGGQLRLAVPAGPALRVLHLMGLDRLLPVYPSRCGTDTRLQV
jgi:anti-anti-sigma regulatory factor